MYMAVAVTAQNKHHTLYYCFDNREGPMIWSTVTGVAMNLIMGVILGIIVVVTNVVLVADIDTACVLQHKTGR